MEDTVNGINIDVVNGNGNALRCELVAKLTRASNSKQETLLRFASIETLLKDNRADVSHTERTNGWTPISLLALINHILQSY